MLFQLCPDQDIFVRSIAVLLAITRNQLQTHHVRDFTLNLIFSIHKIVRVCTLDINMLAVCQHATLFTKYGVNAAEMPFLKYFVICCTNHRNIFANVSRVHKHFNIDDVTFGGFPPMNRSWFCVSALHVLHNRSFLKYHKVTGYHKVTPSAN